MSNSKMPLRKPSRIRVVDDVRQSLERAILSGVMRPGERLAEAHLAEELAVSRTTVREALLMLETCGLVVSVPRRGTFVTRLSAKDALEISYLRALLEGFAVSVARDRIDDVMLDRLTAITSDLVGCRLPADIPRVIELDQALHTALVEAAELPRLLDLWAGLNGRVGALILRSIESKQLTLADLVAFHLAYLADLRSPDPQVRVLAVIRHYIDTAADAAGHAQHVAHMVELMSVQQAEVGDL